MEVAIDSITAQGCRHELDGSRGQFLSVLVPCHNEATTVPELFSRLRDAMPEAEIIVVDDGSTDGSAEIIRDLKASLKLVVVFLAARSGKGAAVRQGLLHATRPWVVIQDADLEYDPRDLQRLATTAIANPDCAVYGSRYLHRGKAAGGSALPYYGVKALAFLAGCLFGRNLSDPHTCYKLLPTTMLKRLSLQSKGFELCAEITGKLLKNRIPIVEVPIAYKPRPVSEGKKIRPSDFVRAVGMYLHCWSSRSDDCTDTAGGGGLPQLRIAGAYWPTYSHVS